LEKKVGCYLSDKLVELRVEKSKEEWGDDNATPA
jgi:hypothetical protein